MKRRTGFLAAVVLAGACASGGGHAPGATGRDLEEEQPAAPAAGAAAVPDAASEASDVAELQLSVEPSSIRVGDTARVVVRAVNASGAEVAGLEFRVRAPRRLLDVIDDGSGLVAVREGSGAVTAQAVRDAVPVSGAPIASLDVVVRPAPLVRLEISAPETMYAGTRAAASTAAFTEWGPREQAPIPDWDSSDPGVLQVTGPTGGLLAIRPGIARLGARVEAVSAARDVRVVPNPARLVELDPAAADVEVGEVVHMSAAVLAGAGRSLEDAAVEWSVGVEPGNSAGAAQVAPDGSFVANGPGTYRVVATFGDLSAVSEIRARPRPPRQAVRLVGRHPLPAGAGATTDLWVFEGLDGRDYAYTGTLAAATLYVWDVTDPASPALADSAKLDGRRVNDVKINDDATIAVVTSEGAANRRNGITLFDILDPAHPKLITHFTENLTGGVHNVWIEGDVVYAVHDGTRDLHIVDISDPAAPRHVGRWGVESEGRSLHDVMVKDGLAYLSYWNDGLVILDVGAGIAGGTPTAPRFVSSHVYSYPLGAESYGNTHHAVRYRNWVFVADEIFDCADCVNGPRGYVHVLDVADIENPVEVAFYRVPEAGAHNMWVEDDRLYVAYYQAGVRVVDISGELRGDLWKQGREVGWFMTEAADGEVPNAAMAWGPHPYKGSLFVSDLNSGLWVLRLEAEDREPVP